MVGLRLRAELLRVGVEAMILEKEWCGFLGPRKKKQRSSNTNMILGLYGTEYPSTTRVEHWKDHASDVSCRVLVHNVPTVRIADVVGEASASPNVDAICDVVVIDIEAVSHANARELSAFAKLLSERVPGIVRACSDGRGQKRASPFSGAQNAISWSSVSDAFHITFDPPHRFFQYALPPRA